MVNLRNYYPVNKTVSLNKTARRLSGHSWFNIYHENHGKSACLL